MKKIGFIICFLVLSSSIFGQQILWSTVKNIEGKYVPLSKVTNEVLELYDQYQYYYDFSGFSKDVFLERFNNADWINDIEELTVFAMRANDYAVLGEGQNSFVIVFCVSKNNVNMLSFTNSYESGGIRTYSSDRNKFLRWFRTLLN
jgi:hypothetical protein